MLDTRETEVVDQMVEVINGHIHPFLIFFHLPGWRVIFTVDNVNTSFCAILQQTGYGGDIPCFVILAGCGVVIAVRAVYHAAYVLRLHEVKTFVESFPVFVRNGGAPRFSFVIGVPLGTVADVVGVDDFWRDCDFYRFFGSAG